jgi:23S rRNA (cytosine1962-C5)-methyltransferase
MQTPFLLYPTDWVDYELIDSGHGNKLERFGSYRMIRPDPRALWHPILPEETWAKADTRFIRTDEKSGQWDTKQNHPPNWSISYNNLVFTLKPTEFKHVGVFPEQAVNWKWLTSIIDGKPLNILNLFAYTGGATLAAAQAGGRVTHVDSVKSTITWANENVRASNLTDKPIRWIEDDAYKFVMREAKRDSTYDGIIMDPPRFGRGPRGEVWKIEEDLPKLLSSCQQILSPHPALFLINAYTADLSPLVLHHLLSQTMKNFGGTTSFGELALQQSSDNNLLPNGICARWSI